MARDEEDPGGDGRPGLYALFWRLQGDSCAVKTDLKELVRGAGFATDSGRGHRVYGRHRMPFSALEAASQTRLCIQKPYTSSSEPPSPSKG